MEAGAERSGRLKPEDGAMGANLRCSWEATSVPVFSRGYPHLLYLSFRAPRRPDAFNKTCDKGNLMIEEFISVCS